MARRTTGEVGGDVDKPTPGAPINGRMVSFSTSADREADYSFHRWPWDMKDEQGED